MSEAMTVIGWSLRAPSASGGKEYRIMMAEEYVLIGWGSVNGTKQYKVQRFASKTAAQAFAVEQTSAKEQGNYTLHDSPKHLTTTEAKRELLDTLLSHRGGSSALDSSYSTLMSRGALLAA
jgi:predicted DNA-binding WGR domain protein